MTALVEKNEKCLQGKDDSSKSFTELESIINECLETKGTWGLIQNDIMFAITFWSMLQAGFISSYHLESRKAGNKSKFEMRRMKMIIV